MITQDRTVREVLFRDWEGCTDHYCIVKESHGMCTNGRCSCLQNMNRTQMHVFVSRLYTIIDKQVK